MRLIPTAAVAIVAALAMPAAAQGPAWREDATRLYYDRELHLAWANAQGDWVDAAGKAQGTRAFASAGVAKGVGPRVVTLDVTALVRAHGADFRINADDVATFNSREAADGHPTLRVTKGGSTRTLQPAADTSMERSTVSSQGARPTLTTTSGLMMRFDQPSDAAITKAELSLTLIKARGATTLSVYRPAPALLRPDPSIESVPARSLGRPARVVAQWTGRNIKPRDNISVAGDVATAYIEDNSLTLIGDIFPLPGARTDAYLTVVIKLHADWRAKGGKLPGLSNTGQLEPPAEGCVIGGFPAKRGGWGGRPANGCRWSARTGYWGQREGRVGAGTYYYAVAPRSVNGVVDYWPLTLPKGRWFAYVQRVKLNDPGRANGVLAYWLVDAGVARNGRAVHAKDNIVWRDTADRASAINEVWANVYCGGRNCGVEPWPRSTVSLKRLTVTDALPDMAAIQGEIDRMNRG